MAEPLLDQQQTTFDGVVQIDSQGPKYYRQYFTAGISGKLDAVSLYLGCCKNGNGFSDGNLYIDISGGGISSGHVITAGSLWWPSSPMWRTFTLEDAPVVEAGEQYYIRLHSTASQDAGHLWGVTSSDVYSGGDFEHYVDGSGWSDTGHEATFKTYVIPSDGTPPETTITSGPSGIVSDPHATFTFSSSEGSSTFKCRTSGGVHGGGIWSACQAPWNIGPSPNGTYTLEVKASDASGSTDPTPATRSWTVDTTLDTASPSITLSTPSEGATYNLNQTVTADYSC